MLCPCLGISLRRIAPAWIIFLPNVKLLNCLVKISYWVSSFTCVEIEKSFYVFEEIILWKELHGKHWSNCFNLFSPLINLGHNRDSWKLYYEKWLKANRISLQTSTNHSELCSTLFKSGDDDVNLLWRNKLWFLINRTIYSMQLR